MFVDIGVADVVLFGHVVVSDTYYTHGIPSLERDVLSTEHPVDIACCGGGNVVIRLQSSAEALQ